MNPTGLIIYAGPSLIDDKRRPIVAVATLRSENRKTGNAIQVWVLPKRANPLAAVASRLARIVCGKCPLAEDVCYVNLGQAPLMVYRKMRRNGYPVYDDKIHRHLLAGRVIRWGAWGDSAAMPQSLVKFYNRRASGHLAYSHQILDGSLSRARSDRIATTHMASAHSRELADLAHARGYRFFQTVADESEAHPSAIECPHVKVSCSDCLLCQGTSKSARNIYILAHGKGKASLGGVQ